MEIGEVNGSEFRRSHAGMSTPENDNESTASESRALVALDPLQDRSGSSASYRYAPFVAHLVATKDQHPQTRERRRANPSDALALALRVDCPIFVDETVLKNSKVSSALAERGSQDQLRSYLEGLSDEDLGRYKM